MKHGVGFNGKCNLVVESMCMLLGLMRAMHVKPLGLPF